MRTADQLPSRNLRNPYLDRSDVRVVSWKILGLPFKPVLDDIGRHSQDLVITDVTFGPSKYKTEYRSNRAFFLFQVYGGDGGRFYTFRNGTMAEAICQKLASFNSGARRGEPTLGRFEVRPSETNPNRAIIDFVVAYN